MFIKILKSIPNEIHSLAFLIITSYPDSKLGKILRKKYWSKKLKNCGSNIDIHMRATIGCPELIEIGDNFMLSVNAHITAYGSKGIFVGNNVGIGRGSFLHASNHVYDDIDKPIRFQGIRSNDISYQNQYYSIIIEDDVLIGSNAVILTGTKIGKGSIVSPGSVLSGEFPPYSVIVGNPARISKNRKTSMDKND
ncbi:MAG: 2,3,4,5-tetrahydropyridine-2,6-dicarboxylate N-acetyltransferase [Alphaproteobacteria bacterium MarineAlpha5_Bin6]|nr:MAG: 2,3,4,5-tetrahydropyridine-2,6-dicarboxylate N-acetyltransferase [Alphaproteobacteria bacterium MarineAlpha5_Bin6]|tara:strand:+ start:1204 stop:1785 length:582 start_codon:yes stop_codon:yes gene_type:complete